MTLLITAALGLAWQTITSDAAEHARAGIALQQQGHLPDAITEFRKVTELAPDFPAAFVNLGAACLQNHDYAAAISPLKRALELNNNLPGAHQMLGYALLAQGYAAESIPHLQGTNTWDALGIAQLKTGDFSGAITSLQAALKQRPNDPDLLYYLGRATGLLSKSASTNSKQLTRILHERIKLSPRPTPPSAAQPKPKKNSKLPCNPALTPLAFIWLWDSSTPNWPTGPKPKGSSAPRQPCNQETAKPPTT